MAYKGTVPWNKGMKMSKDFCQRCSDRGKGRKLSKEHCLAMSRALKGLKRGPFSIEHKRKLSISCTGKNIGGKHGLWKGDKVGYRALHIWINNTFGKAVKCEICKAEGLPRYHWANISGKYKRDISDWIQACPSCHFQRDHAKKRGEKCLTF